MRPRPTEAVRRAVLRSADSPYRARGLQEPQFTVLDLDWAMEECVAREVTPQKKVRK